MALQDGDDEERLSPLVVIGLFALNLVPLITLIPAVAAWSAGGMPGHVLLPVVVLPTVVLATHAPARLYRAQLVVAIAMCVVCGVLDSKSTPILLSGAISTIGTLIFTTVLIERSRRALHTLWDGLRRAAVTDPLTGVLNRRGAVVRLTEVTGAAAAAGQPVGLAAIDLDYFKRINDEYGHAAGDDVLRAVCDAARTVVGAAGLVVRSGGEELVLLTVGDPVPAAGALMAWLAGRGQEPRVTVSVGAVRADPALLRGGDDLWAAVDLADRALYRAKAAGRDCIIDGGDFEGAHRAAEIAEAEPLSALMGDAVQRDLFRDFCPSGVRGWRRAVDRARARQIDPAAHRLYVMIVGWTMFVGGVTTIQQMISGSMPAAQGWVALPVGWIFGAVIILVMRRLKTAWAITPVFAGGSLFEVAVVFTVGAESRPAALMLSLLVGLLVVLYWPRWPVLAQAAATVVACAGAAFVAGRPASIAVAVFAATALSLLAALVLVAAQRRREETAEEELRTRAVTDPLTGVGNRRALQLAGERWERGYIAMVDVDSFKALNDRYGHGRGDAVLCTLALDLHDVAGGVDAESRVFRIGGDEFVLAGPGRLPEDLAERIETALRAVPVTVSVGCSEWDAAAGGDGPGAEPAAPGLWEALAVADRKMFGRKRARQA